MEQQTQPIIIEHPKPSFWEQYVLEASVGVTVALVLAGLEYWRRRRKRQRQTFYK